MLLKQIRDVVANQRGDFPHGLLCVDHAEALRLHGRELEERRARALLEVVAGGFRSQKKG